MRNRINFRNLLKVASFALIVIVCGFTLTRAAEITRISPSSGGPGKVITVYGRGFGESVGKSALFFGTIPADIVSWSDKKIETSVPYDLKPSDLVEKGKGRRKKLLIPVTVKTGQTTRSEPYYFDAVPRVYRLSPDRGGPGTLVEARGKNFGMYIDLGKVMVGTTPAKVVKWEESVVTFHMPSKINLSDVVEEKSRRSAKKQVKVFLIAGNLKSEGKFFRWNPVITGFEPDRSAPGTVVELRGRNFGSLTSAVQVKIGEKSVKPSRVKSDRITFKIPLDLEQGTLKDGKLAVRVIAGGVESNTKDFEAAPHIRYISPSRGKGGTVTVSGYNFGSEKDHGSIKIASDEDDKPPFKVTVEQWEDEKIVFHIPDDLELDEDTVYNVKVTVGGLSSNQTQYTYKKTGKKTEK